MPDFHVTAFDLVLFFGYVLGTRILFGWYFASKTKGKGAESYFLGGRSLRWPIIGLSFYVANMSGSSFIALPASGYNDGIAAYNYEWIPSILLIFFIIFILPLYLRGKVYTSPEYFPYLYSCGISFVASCLLLLSISWLTAAPTAEQVDTYVWRQSIWNDESAELVRKHWYENYRILAVGLLALTMAVVFWWW